MALDDMLRAIEEEGETLRQEILEKAKEDAAEIIKKAKEDAKNVKEDYIVRSQATLQGEKTRILSDAKLFVKKQVIQAKEKHIEEAFSGAAKKLESLRTSKEYADYFRRLLEETMDNAEGKLVLSVDKRDKDVAAQAISKIGLDCELKTDLTCLGGLRATTLDGKITLTNTFDSRLERAKQLLKPEVTTMMFG